MCIFIASLESMLHCVYVRLLQCHSSVRSHKAPSYILINLGSTSDKLYEFECSVQPARPNIWPKSFYSCPWEGRCDSEGTWNWTAICQWDETITIVQSTRHVGHASRNVRDNRNVRGVLAREPTRVPREITWRKPSDRSVNLRRRIQC